MKTREFAKLVTFISALALLPLATYAQSAGKDALTILKEGNQRFCDNQMIHPNQDRATVERLSKGQHPFAVIVSCSDSRVTGEIIFDQGLGDLFTIRTAGNVMGDYEEGSIEYAAEHLGTKLIVVTGHTNCGAVKAFLDINEEEHKHSGDNKHEDLGHIQAIIDNLKSEKEMEEALKTDDHLYYRAVKANVIHGVQQLRNSDPILSKMYKEGKINIVGAIYDIETGKVEFLNI